MSGSDISDSELLRTLAKEGIQIHIGENAGFVPNDSDLIIYSEAIITKPDLSVEENLNANAELKKAFDLKIKTQSYPQALAAIIARKKSIAVCGSHGKSTTTAMI